MAEFQPDLINPYAPTAATTSEQEEFTRELVAAAERDAYVPASFGWTAFRWFGICTLSAVPSFLVGLAVTGGRWDAMLVGIFLFSLAYTFADYLTARQSWRKKRLIRRTLRTMYGTRIAITIIFPVGYFLDVCCGFASLYLTQAITGPEFASGDQYADFFPTLLTTLVQGAVMNVVLGVYGLLVWGLLALIGFLRR
jgi:hypothetical protein